MPYSIPSSTKIFTLATVPFLFILVGAMSVCGFIVPPGRKGTLFFLHIQLNNHQKDLNPCLSLYYYGKFIAELEKNTIKEFNCVYGHSVQPPFLVDEIEPPTKFSKTAGGELEKISIFRGALLGKRGMTFFRGAAVLT